MLSRESVHILFQMNPVLLLLLLLVGYSDDTVVTLDADTYHPFLDSHSEVLVKYYTSVVDRDPFNRSGASIANNWLLCMLRLHWRLRNNILMLFLQKSM